MYWAHVVYASGEVNSLMPMSSLTPITLQEAHSAPPPPALSGAHHPARGPLSPPSTRPHWCPSPCRRPRLSFRGCCWERRATLAKRTRAPGMRWLSRQPRPGQRGLGAGRGRVTAILMRWRAGGLRRRTLPVQRLPRACSSGREREQLRIPDGVGWHKVRGRPQWLPKKLQARSWANRAT